MNTDSNSTKLLSILTSIFVLGTIDVIIVTILIKKLSLLAPLPWNLSYTAIVGVCAIAAAIRILFLNSAKPTPNVTLATSTTTTFIIFLGSWFLYGQTYLVLQVLSYLGLQ